MLTSDAFYRLVSLPDSEFDKLRAVGVRGKRMMYPFDRIEVGQGFHAPLRGYREWRRDPGKTMRQLYTTLYQSAYRMKDKEFSIFQDGEGYTVVRVS